MDFCIRLTSPKWTLSAVERRNAYNNGWQGAAEKQKECVSVWRKDSKHICGRESRSAGRAVPPRFRFWRQRQLAVYLSGTEAPSMGFIGLVLLVAAVILISPVAERRNLMGEQYWITNQRAILMTRDKTFFYMELSDIDDLQVVGGTTKGKSLVLGRCLFEEAKKLLRWRACHPKVDVQSHDETDRALGMIFYGVQGAEAAAELLRQGRDGEAA